VTSDDARRVESLLGIAGNQPTVDSFEDGHHVSVLVDILVQIDAVVRVCPVQQSSPQDGPRVALQVLEQEKAFLIVIILKDEAWREKVQIRQVFLTVRDAAYFELAKSAVQSLLLGRESGCYFLEF
jgi:predicted nucleic acid-binding protein